MFLLIKTLFKKGGLRCEMPLCAYEFWLKFSHSQKHESLLQTISLILFLRKRFLAFFHFFFYENIQTFYE